MPRNSIRGALIAALALLAPTASARAFCGFYVAGTDTELHNDATMVVMLREGTTTVLSMQNDYVGPAEDFAMVVPVPVVLSEDNVHTLPRDVFERVDHLAAPRLVEYWEQDPCRPPYEEAMALGSLGAAGYGTGGGGSGFGSGGLAVTVEAEFAVGEYDIVVLGARDSSDLETWLRQHRYHIPEGAASSLRPYVEGGSKFFVARVDASRVTFEEGRAVLSPLRIHYESDTFSLPVRLGMLNSPGTQDLVVHILARNQRYEVANYDNVTIPTNVRVADATRDRYGAFYAALFDATQAAHPGSVVTEYAWQANSCDPCPGPVLSETDLATLGAGLSDGSTPPRPSSLTAGAPEVTPPDTLPSDVVRRVVRRHVNELRYCVEMSGQANVVRMALSFDITDSGTATRASVDFGDQDVGQRLRACVAQAIPRWTFPAPQGGATAHVRYVLDVPTSGAGLQSFVLTRLHYRYQEGGLDEDLVFRAAPPIVGGRGVPEGDAPLTAGAEEGSFNAFQGRYVITHPWAGPVDCESPRRGVYGAPPEGVTPPPASAARSTLVPRGALDLSAMLVTPVTALGLAASASNAAAEPTDDAAPDDDDAPEAPTSEAPADEQAPPDAPAANAGCGCRAARVPGRAPLALVLAGLVLLARRRTQAARRGRVHREPACRRAVTPRRAHPRT